MDKVISRDGTSIAFDRSGEGPPMLLVDGALCYRASGPMRPPAAQLSPHFTVFTYDRRGRRDSGDTAPYAVEREVDDSRPPLPNDFLAQLNGSLAEGRRGDAVRLFMKLVGLPGILVALMRFLPGWSKLEAIAHTLVYDMTILKDNQRGKPLPPGKWSSVTAPMLVVAGGSSPAWMRHAMQALAAVLPSAKLRTLERQTHMVRPKVLAPALVEFFGR